MFLELFYSLKSLGVPVSPTEWIALMSALEKGLHRHTLEDFYYLSRSLLVKDVAHYDAFDQSFSHVFQNGAIPDDLATKADVLKWLSNPLNPLNLPPEELEKMKKLSLEELLEELEERLRTQDGAHHGGHHWIGTGGTSPFGYGGAHPTGISFAPEGGGGRAVVQAFERKYRNMRNDVVLDVRQMSIALKRLRDLRQTGNDEVLDVEETVDKTCKNAGEIDLVFTRERENQVRLILAMDTGGSMEPYRKLTERLFSAANSINHFKEFHAYYFHNCVYENMYEDIEKDEYISSDDFVKKYKKNYRLVMVGDAAMAPYELMIPNGTLERYRASRVKGIDRLRALAEMFPKRVWLNPMKETSWEYYSTIQTIRGLFPMYPLTLSGIDRAVKQLL